MKRFIATLGLLFVILAPQTVAAYSPLGDACSAAGNNSSACANANTQNNPLTGPNGTFVKVTRIIALIAGVAAVIMIVIGGLQFITSGGDSQRVSGARNMILYAVIGLVIIVLAQAIITFIISKV
ncbi:MAG: hypothetical protein WC498_03770 [Candidatus Saccharimonadales bacterium]